MDREDFLNILREPLKVKETDYTMFSGLVKIYPLFPVARVLEMMAAGAGDHDLEKELLKKNAAHLNNLNYTQWLIRKYNSLNIEHKNLVENVHGQNEDISFSPDSPDPANLSVDNPKEDDLMAFEFKSGDIVEKDIKHGLSTEYKLSGQVEENSRKSELIERFIRINPGSIRADENTPLPDVVIEEDGDDESLISDTLAKIYIKQGLYSKAIYAYEKLILKYPEKNSYFAAQIEDIKKLINK